MLNLGRSAEKQKVATTDTEVTIKGRTYTGEEIQASIINGFLLARIVIYKATSSDRESDQENLRPVETYGVYGTSDIGPVSVESTAFKQKDQLVYEYKYSTQLKAHTYGTSLVTTVRDGEENIFPKEERKYITDILGIKTN